MIQTRPPRRKKTCSSVFLSSFASWPFIRPFIFFYVWSKWFPIEAHQYYIATIVNKLAVAFGKKAKRLLVYAHSAGGVLLLRSLGRKDPSKEYFFDSSLVRHIDLSFHIVASPLGGYGHKQAKNVSLLIGPIRTLVGGNVVYENVDPLIDLHIWYTTFAYDKAMVRFEKRDMRFPLFKGTKPKYKKHFLPYSDHEQAVYDAGEVLFELQDKKK